MSQSILNRKSSFADKTKAKRKSTTFLVPDFEFINDESTTSTRLLSPNILNESEHENINNFSNNNNNNNNNINEDKQSLFLFKKTNSIYTDETMISNSSISSNLSTNLASKKSSNSTSSNLNRESKYRPITPKLYFSYFSNKSNQQMVLTPRFETITESDSTKLVKSLDENILRDNHNTNLLKNRLPRLTKVVKQNLLRNQDNNNSGFKIKTNNYNQHKSVFFPLLLGNDSKEARKSVSFAPTLSATNSNNNNSGSNKNGNLITTSSRPTSSNHKILDYIEDPLGIYFVQNISNLGQS
jgi:hypothetical protein